MKYIILAGGLGTRLQSAVSDVPKPMAPIHGRPFLEILLEHLLPYDAEKFILCVSHKREVIMKHFGSGFLGIPISYSIEKEALGTGGAIVQAFRSQRLQQAITVNGDTLINADYMEFSKICAKSSFGMILAEVEDTGRYGRVEHKDGKISRFLEKSDSSGPGLINAGSYWITEEAIKMMPTGAFSLEKDFLEPLIHELAPVYFIARSYFIDIGLPETYFRARQELA